MDNVLLTNLASSFKEWLNVWDSVALFCLYCPKILVPMCWLLLCFGKRSNLHVELLDYCCFITVSAVFSRSIWPVGWAGWLQLDQLDLIVQLNAPFLDKIIIFKMVKSCCAVSDDVHRPQKWERETLKIPTLVCCIIQQPCQIFAYHVVCLYYRHFYSI